MSYFGWTPGGTVQGGTYVSMSTVGGYGSPSMPAAGSSSRQNISLTPGGNVGMSGGAMGGGQKKDASYTGYDAAVYAAATSYLQSKHTGTTKDWMKKTPSNGTGSSGGGGGSFPARKSWNPATAGPMHYCDVCKVSCAGPQAYSMHLEGQKHKKKATMANADTSLPIAQANKPTYKCELCQACCNGQDAYNAHVRGKSHQKAIKLHLRLNKPIPSQPTVIPAAKPSTVVVGGPVGMSSGGNTEPIGGVTKVIAVPQMNFVGGNALKTTAPAQPEVEKEPEPVGEDYVEALRNAQGRIVYKCKLCDCEFNDSVAKDMHLKGRRHRLNYKKKVDPRLEVEVKGSGPTAKARRLQEERLRKELMTLRRHEMMGTGPRQLYVPSAAHPSIMGTGPPQLFSGPGRFSTGTAHLEQPVYNGPRPETEDDAMVSHKHREIYPTDDDLRAVHNVVTLTERALKGVSDVLQEDHEKAIKEKAAAAAAAATPATEGETKEEGAAAAAPANATESPPEERVLKGVMRVGVLAKGLLLKNNLNVHLVCLCAEFPTRALLDRVFRLLPKQFESISEEKFEFKVSVPEGAVYVNSINGSRVNVTITLTSVMVREPIDNAKKFPSDALDKQKCLDALAALRHTKWFQARCANMQPCLMILRVMRDLCARVPTWTPLSQWALELLVEKVLSSAGSQLNSGEAFRRIFEAVAAGVLLPSGNGMLDPCEKEASDALASMTRQQREDITASAQHALRLIAFRQIWKILAVDPSEVRFPGRKRPLEDDDAMDTEINGKKDRKDDSVVAGESSEIKMET